MSMLTDKLKELEGEGRISHFYMTIFNEALAEHDKETYNKAIDDFTAELIKHISNVPSKRIGGGNVFVVADQMKHKDK